MINIMLTSVSVLVIVAHFSSNLEPNNLSISLNLVLSQTDSILMVMSIVIKALASFESNLTVVQRFDKFLKKNIESSNSTDNLEFLNGSINFEKFSLRFDNNIALKNINLKIKSGEKVLICGRTGSGKSTLVTSMFNIRDKNFLKGDIEIGGHSIFDYSLNSLRSQLTIIPQQPFVFNNSLRYNLDPEERKEDEILWESLKNADLYDYFITKNGGLEFKCSDKNLSLGQQQLICLARATLR
ncbi:MAG: Canalicular multispecific organic anion transporter 2, partial [Paramarteilia canceri]